MENSEKWGVDMFRISELTDKKTLTCVTYTIFQERDLIKTFKIPGKVFLNFLRTLEDHYLQVNHQTLLVLQTLCELSRSILRLISATLINHQIIFAWINIHHWLDSECWCSTKRRLLLFISFFQFSFWSFHFFFLLFLHCTLRYSIPHTTLRNPSHPIHTQSICSFTVLNGVISPCLQFQRKILSLASKLPPIGWEMILATLVHLPRRGCRPNSRLVTLPLWLMWPDLIWEFRNKCTDSCFITMMLTMTRMFRTTTACMLRTSPNRPTSSSTPLLLRSTSA